MSRSIIIALLLSLAVSVSSCQMTPAQQKLTVDWQYFRQIDIYCHSSPHDIYQELVIPESVSINYLFLKIYPIEERAPGLIVGFFKDMDGEPASLPFHEEAVVTETKQGQFTYDWSVSAAYADIRKLPRGKKLWLGFRERNNSYDQPGGYNYNSQMVTDGKVASHQARELYSCATLVGRSYRGPKYIDSDGYIHRYKSNSTIPYAFGTEVDGIESRIPTNKKEHCRLQRERENKQELMTDTEQKAKVQQYFTCYSGNGHGGSLKLMQFQKIADNTYSVLCAYVSTGSIVNRIEPRSKWPGDAYRLKMKKALIDISIYKKARRICISGLNHAQDKPKEIGRMTSNDFILGLRLFDGRETCEKIYCGYSDSAKESFYKPLLEASIELNALSDNFKWKEQDDPELAGFVTDTFILLYPKFKDSSWWWPKDRLIRMIGRNRNTRAIPLLIKMIKETRKKVYSDNGHVNERNLGYIVTALDEITEQKLRFDKQGDPRPLNDVVQDYLARHDKKETIHNKAMDSDKK